MNTVLLTFSIVLLTSNPGSSLTCWNCTPYHEMATECAQESAQIPISPKETTKMPTGLSTQLCSDSADAACVSMRSGMMSEGKLTFVTVRKCLPIKMSDYSFNLGSFGNKCLELDMSDAFVGKTEICACHTDLCNGNTNISRTEQPQRKAKEISTFLTKVDELEDEPETLVDKLEN